MAGSANNLSLPAAEARYRARFTFDPNSISIGYSGMHDIFVGRNGTIDVFRVQVTKLYSSYQLRTQARFDSATYTTTAWLPIADAAHLIEIDLQAATSSGANNGYLALWIDGAQQSTLANLDNDTRRIDEARLGPSNGIDTYTRGTEYFDDFESRRSTYIGPVVPTLVASEIHKTYYRTGAQLIAMRVEGDPTVTNNGLFFLHSDHLGSASLTTDANGTAIARQLYDAWGNIRANVTTGKMPTDIGYTGQRLDASTGGLMFYNARYYAPSLNRFISADTIVPNPSSPQQLNRYAYGLNNPIKYIDPSGHFIQCAATGQDHQCSDDGYSIDNPWNTSSDADTRRAWLLDYANSLATWARNGWLTDLDALGQLSDFAVSLIPGGASNRTLAYVNDMSSVLIGAEGVNVLLKSLTAGYDAPNFGDTGFHPNYQDGQNQLYHFWAYVTTVANGNNLGGWFMGTAGNVGHEMLDPGEAFRKLKTGNSGMSWEDYHLAYTGMVMGHKLANGAVPIEQAGSWMRGALSTEFPGTKDNWQRSLGTAWWPSKIWERAVTTVAQVLYIDWYYYMPK